MGFPDLQGTFSCLVLASNCSNFDPPTPLWQEVQNYTSCCCKCLRQESVDWYRCLYLALSTQLDSQPTLEWLAGGSASGYWSRSGRHSLRGSHTASYWTMLDLYRMRCLTLARGSWLPCWHLWGRASLDEGLATVQWLLQALVRPLEHSKIRRPISCRHEIKLFWLACLRLIYLLSIILLRLANGNICLHDHLHDRVDV